MMQKIFDILNRFARKTHDWKLMAGLLGWFLGEAVPAVLVLVVVILMVLHSYGAQQDPRVQGTRNVIRRG
jgi:hypothetical protein